MNNNTSSGAVTGHLVQWLAAGVHYMQTHNDDAFLKKKIIVLCHSFIRQTLSPKFWGNYCHDDVCAAFSLPYLLDRIRDKKFQYSDRMVSYSSAKDLHSDTAFSRTSLCSPQFCSSISSYVSIMHAIRYGDL